MSLENIRKMYKTCAKCKEAGCSLKTNGIQRVVIIDAEQHRSLNAPMCDCIIVAHMTYFIIGVCELKSGDYDVRQVEKKLEAGVKLAMKICDCNLSAHECKILPILIGKKLKRTDGLLLAKSKIKINGKKHSLLCYNCGTCMLKIIKEVCI